MVGLRAQQNARPTFTIRVSRTNIQPGLETKVIQQTTYARTSDGRALEGWDAPESFPSDPGYMGLHVREILHPDGRKQTTTEAMRGVETIVSPSTVFKLNNEQQAVMQQCKGIMSKIIGEEVFHGQKMLRMISDSTTVHQEELEWPAAGCLAVESDWTWHEKNNPAKMTSRTITKVEYFVLGEPDEALFVVPSDYKEESFHDTERRYLIKRFGSVAKAPEYYRNRYSPEREASYKRIYAMYGPNGTEVSKALALLKR
jgi:hypothetical protein